MKAKSAKNRAGRNTPRSPARSSGGDNTLKKYGLIVGIVALAVLAVAALAILGQGSSPTASQTGPAELSLDKSIGAEDAPVVVVEYADFQCPFCRQFAFGPERQLRADYVDTGKARFVFRHLAFLGPESLQAAEAAECANEQDRFWDYHDKLFEAQTGENVGDFSQDNLKRFAAELSLETSTFNQCLDSNKYQAKVQQEVTEAGRLGIRSTPTLFVNGQLLRNGSDYPVLQAAIEAAQR
jgi:protein-disulfide isomerase